MTVGRKGAVFLDRDGTINVKAPDGAYVTTPSELILLEGAAGAVAAINEAGRRAIVVTNQRGIARGIMSEQELDAIHARLDELLATASGAFVDGIFYCPHDIGECRCRKPGAEMLLDACQRWPEIRFAESVMVGDSESDIAAARAVGMPGIRIGGSVDSLAEAVRDCISWEDG